MKIVFNHLVYWASVFWIHIYSLYTERMAVIYMVTGQTLRAVDHPQT
jgi:hypothetical protein